MSDAAYVRLMAVHLEHVVECFTFSKPPYQNDELAKRANDLRWDILKFLNEVKESQCSDRSTGQ